MVCVGSVFTNLAELQTRHNGVRTRQVTRLALVVSGVILPRALVAVPLLLGIKRNRGVQALPVV